MFSTKTLEYKNVLADRCERGGRDKRLLDAINFMVEVLKTREPKKSEEKEVGRPGFRPSEDTCLQKQRIRGNGGGSEDKFSVLLRLSITGCEMEWRRNLETIVMGLNV